MNTHNNKQLDNLIMEATIDNISMKLQNGDITSEDMVKWYLKRIYDLDMRGIKLNSVLQINPDALAIARKRDKETIKKGPLHGITILLKGNMDTFDSMLTTNGSWALVGSLPTQDSNVAKKLREAGAVILGKSNLSEWTGFRALNIKDGVAIWNNGWSAMGGMSKNPYNLNADTWGSSSGSAVAVAANLVNVAVGSETGGSIILPASSNGVVGLKPTSALIGRGGAIPMSYSFDSIGVLSRTVKDSAIVLGALVGNDDVRDLKNRQISTNKFYKDYTQFLKSKDLKGIRIGILVGMKTGILKEITLPQKVIDIIKEKGAILVPIKLDESTLKLLSKADQLTIDEYEFKDGVNNYLKSRVKNNDPMYKNWPMIKTLAEVIKFNSSHKRLELMSLLGQQLLIAAQNRSSLDDPKYKQVLKDTQGKSQEFINTVFKKYNLDVFMGPMTGGLLSDPAAAAGYPRITFPLMLSKKDHLPISIELTGLAFDEPMILRVAYILEQAIKGRKIPQFQP